MKRRKALGNKRNDISKEDIAEITKIYGDFKESEISQIYDDEDFGYTKITVERPLRDEEGNLVLKKGKKQPDTSLRDTENVPLKEDIKEYFEREVLPFAPDAWVDEKKSKVGYEIPFTRYFYKYEAPRPSAEIMAEIMDLHFAVDLTNVYMTTRLEGAHTYFLPFNQGSNGAGKVGGKGNPVNPNGYDTAYLWERVLCKDSLMEILQKYMHLQQEYDKNGNLVKETMIFPRYHQLDVVTKLLEDVKKNGSGKSYLIQHSAGSGKSNSIAWLAHRLVVMSPFLSESVIADFNLTDRALSDCKRTLVTRRSELGKLKASDVDNFTIYALKDEIIDGEEEISDELADKKKQDIHAKIYLRRKYSDVDL